MPAGSFDPYQQWLGIPPELQPPNHYQLLGIAELEGDRDVIANAATRQAFRLRKLQDGPQGELAKQLLREIALAKATLLEPKAKAAYDKSIAPPIVAATPEPVAIAAVEIVPEPSFRRKTTDRKGTKAKGSSGGTLLSRLFPLVAIAGVLGLVLYLSDLKPAEKPELASVEQEPTGPPSAPGQPEGPKAVSPAEEPPSRATAEETTDEAPEEMGDESSPEREAEAMQDEPADVATTPADGKMPADGAEMDSAMSGEEMASPAAVEEGEMQAHIDPTKTPVPSAEDEADAAKRIRTQYKADFAKAKTAEQKVALAKTLLEEAQQTDEGSVSRFAETKLAIGLARAGGDYRLVSDGWQKLAEHYQVDPLASVWDALHPLLRAKTVAALKKNARSARLRLAGQRSTHLFQQPA